MTPLSTVFDTQCATYIGDGALGQHSMYRLQLSKPIVAEDEDEDTLMEFALAYQNDRSDDAFEYGHVFEVQFRERVQRKPFSKTHCIVDIVNETPTQKPNTVQDLERDVTLPHKSAAQIETSKDGQQVRFWMPHSVLKVFDEVTEQIAGDYAQNRKRYRALKVLLEHYLASHPF